MFWNQKLGLQMNDSKTKFMAYNIKEDVTLVTKTAREPPGTSQILPVPWLMAWVDESEKDFKIRKALAWKACNKVHTL